MNYMGNVLPLAVQAAWERADENDRQKAAEELAEEDFDKWLRGEDDNGTVSDYIGDAASERIRLLVRGLLGDEYALDTARQEAHRLRSDAVSYSAWLMSDERIAEAL